MLNLNVYFFFPLKGWVLLKWEQWTPQESWSSGEHKQVTLGQPLIFQSPSIRALGKWNGQDRVLTHLSVACGALLLVEEEKVSFAVIFLSPKLKKPQFFHKAVQGTVCVF